MLNYSELQAQLKNKAIGNGVSSVSILSSKEVHKIEPNIRAVGALYSPSTGIINAHSLMDYYLHKAKMKSAEIVYQTKVVGIEPNLTKMLLTCRAND